MAFQTIYTFSLDKITMTIGQKIFHLMTIGHNAFNLMTIYLMAFSQKAFSLMAIDQMCLRALIAVLGKSKILMTSKRKTIFKWAIRILFSFIFDFFNTAYYSKNALLTEPQPLQIPKLSSTNYP